MLSTSEPGTDLPWSFGVPSSTKSITNNNYKKEFPMKNKNYNQIAGGLYGLLIGDALGVPYEFHPAEEIPPYSEIEMTPPPYFPRSHASVPAGTWSDDGSQALCLLDSLLTCYKFCLKDFSDRLSAWYENGYLAIEGIVFDVGIQTSEALHAYHTGTPCEKCGLLRPNGKGNGALMRVLPLALYHTGTDLQLVTDAHNQCLITHGHPCNQVCCALYCLTARYLLKNLDFPTALATALSSLRSIYQSMPKYDQELEWSIRPDEPWQGSGSGYVVDCLRSAFMILNHTSSYESAVKQAILLGNDTDTTACVTGGLAGILYGFETIPKRWLDLLKGKSQVEQFLQRLII